MRAMHFTNIFTKAPTFPCNEKHRSTGVARKLAEQFSIKAQFERLVHRIVKLENLVVT